MTYPKPRRPAQELQFLNRTKDYSVISTEPRTPKIPYSHFSEVDFGEDSVTEGSRPRLRQSGFVKTAFIVSYVLIFAAVIAITATIVALMLTRQDAKNSTSYPQSFPLFKAACNSKRLQFN